MEGLLQAVIVIAQLAAELGLAPKHLCLRRQPGRVCRGSGCLLTCILSL